jgi:hypothetical protein
LQDKYRATDYQLVQARAMLTDVANSMEPNRKEWKNVQNTVNAIDTALNVEAPKRTQDMMKGKESQALVEAYTLLSASEFKYGDHRGKAIKHIRLAATNYNANTTKNDKFAAGATEYCGTQSK